MNVIFDTTVSLGHLLTLAGFVGGGWLAWHRLEKILIAHDGRITSLEASHLTHEHRISENEKRTFDLAAKGHSHKSA